MNDEKHNNRSVLTQQFSVSCVIPTYNRADFILDAVRSALIQTYPVNEIIVIDDGSTDDTSSVLQSIRDPRLRYAYQPNAGISKARNVGIHLASGNIIAFLDSDDIWYPNKLEKQLACLSSRDYGLVYCAKSWIDNTGTDIKNPYPQSSFPQGNIFRELFLENFVTTASCVIVQRKCFSDVGLFIESRDFSNGEDYEMWLRIAHTFTIGAVPEELVKYRTHNSNQTSARRKRYRGTLSTLYMAGKLDPDRTLLYKRDYHARLRQVYTLAVSELFYSYDLESCKHFGYEALFSWFVSPKLLLLTLLAHLPKPLLKLARKVYPW